MIQFALLLKKLTILTVFIRQKQSRDLGNVFNYGNRFVKHSGLINHSLYHLTNVESNVINAILFPRKEYGKFKRRFIQVAETLGFEGDIKTHVDLIFAEINKSKTETQPFS